MEEKVFRVRTGISTIHPMRIGWIYNKKTAITELAEIAADLSE